MDNCYKGRIPREARNDQTERLTSKHIQTLSFLQEMACENKLLKEKIQELEEQQSKCAELHAFAEKSKARIQQIQDEYINRADEINSIMAQKHEMEMSHMVEEKKQQEEAYEEMIEKLKDDKRALQDTNRELLDKLGNLAEADEKANLMHMELQDLKGEVDVLKEENAYLKKNPTVKTFDIQQFENLRNQNSQLQEELLTVSQEKNELEIRYAQLQKTLEEVKSDNDKVDMVGKLGKKVAKLHKEKRASEERLQNQTELVEALQEELERTRQDLATVHRHQQITMIEYQKLASEVELLRKHSARMQDKASFKDFVGLKRELNMLKDENENLKQKTKITVNALPCLQANPPPRNGSASKNRPAPVFSLPAASGAAKKT